MQVGAADIADQERVAAEQEPRLLGTAPPVGDRVGVVGGCMTRCCDRRHECVPNLDHVAVGERDMLELDARADGYVGGRAGALDQQGQAGDMVGLDVCLKYGHDRRPDLRCRLEVLLDEIGVRVDDREFGVRAAAEQVAGARARVVQELAKQHPALLSARHFDRPLGAPPLRKAHVQPARFQPALTQQAHGVVGIDAIWAAAVGDHFTPPRQRARDRWERRERS